MAEVKRNKGQTILKVDNLNIRFSNMGKPIVENGSFEVKSGELVLIIGDNGSGKSSVFRSLVRDNSTGVFEKISFTLKRIFGKVKKQEKPINSLNMSFIDHETGSLQLVETSKQLDKFRSSIGYTKQEDDDDSLLLRSVEDYITDYASHSTYCNDWKMAQKNFEEAFEDLHCEAYANGKLKKRTIKVCSGGEKRMVAILSALSRKGSDLFIMDEPINNLDGDHARLLNDYLIDLKNQPNPPGILIITHCRMFQNVDRVYVLRDGHIYDEKELIESDPSYSKYEAQCCYGKCNKFGKYNM